MTEIQQALARAWNEMNDDDKKHYIELSDLEHDRYRQGLEEVRQR